MRFSEHELTAALHGAAKSVLVAQRKIKRGEDVEAAWKAMDRLKRFHLLDSLGSQVLPVLVALPDVEVEPGTRPTYDDEVIAEVVAAQLDQSGGRLKRAVLAKGRVALVKIALASIPPRLDPDALLHAEDDDLPQVPDDLSGL